MSEHQVTITCNEAGDCVAVTRTDREGRIVNVLWERPDLLAALRAIVELADPAAPLHDWEVVERVRTVAADAIAKAEGAMP